jgi:hypothetical protein
MHIPRIYSMHPTTYWHIRIGSLRDLYIEAFRDSGDISDTFAIATRFG